MVEELNLQETKSLPRFVKKRTPPGVAPMASPDEVGEVNVFERKRKQ